MGFLGLIQAIFCCRCLRRKNRPIFEAVGEELELLKTQIEEETQLNLRRKDQRRNGLRRIVLSGVALYTALAAFFYVQESDDPAFRTARLGALAVFPLLVFGLHRQFAWLIDYDIRRRDSRIKQITALLDRKIEMLKEQTNFLKTQNLINRYQTPIKQQQQQQQQHGSPSQTPAAGIPGTARRTGRKGQRPLMQTPGGVKPAGVPGERLASATPMSGMPARGGNGAAAGDFAPEVRLAQDTMDVVVPFQRSNADKFFDYLLGEGPNNRFALICRRCGTHNGLIREEDLGLRYRCSACSFLNGDRSPPSVAPDKGAQQPTAGTGQLPSSQPKPSAHLASTSIAEEPEEAPVSVKLEQQLDGKEDRVDEVAEDCEGDEDDAAASEDADDAYTTPLRKRRSSNRGSR